MSLVRVSGPKAREVCELLCSEHVRILSHPRELVCSGVSEPESGESFDFALVSFFPNPKSYTGEDVLEFNLHGSPYLLERLLQTLQEHEVRLARPGEFTERAYENGLIDLSQAEAVADLIAAETQAQARVAREQLEGKLSEAMSTLGEPLRNLLAEIEAHIDFPEEGIDPLAISKWGEILSAVRETMNSYIETFRFGRLYREGARVVLAGLPNAGKSSILNRFLGESRAIVTDIPGTTRDVIEERCSLDGLLVRFIDTAGILIEGTERSPDLVEKLGIERSWKQVEASDIVLFVWDLRGDANSQTDLFQKVEQRSSSIFLVANKADLFVQPDLTAVMKEINDLIQIKALPLSALSGLGFDSVRALLRTALLGAPPTLPPSQGFTAITTQRHFDALKRSLGFLEEGVLAIKDGVPPEFIALHLRESLGALDEIIGITSNDEILGRIFSKFCIGK